MSKLRDSEADLKFRKGIKNWKETYEVRFECEYTADLEKHITYVNFYKPSQNKGVRVKWNVFKSYLHGETIGYADTTELGVQVKEGKIHITELDFSLTIHPDQLRAIHTASNRVQTEVPGVEDVINRLGVGEQ